MKLKIHDLGNNIALCYEGTKDEFHIYFKYLLDNVTYDFMELDNDKWIIPKSFEENIINNFETEKVIQPWSHIGEDMKLKPYPYQKEVIHYALYNPESLLVLPPGSGKTIIGIGFYLELIKNKMTDKPCIVCTKASLKFQWVQEVKKFSDLRVKEIKTPSALNNNEEKFNQQFKDVDVFVLNYEAFKNKDVAKKLKKTKAETLITD